MCRLLCERRLPCKPAASRIASLLDTGGVPWIADRGFSAGKERTKW
jgi:hypothetical protein